MKPTKSSKNMDTANTETTAIAHAETTANEEIELIEIPNKDSVIDATKICQLADQLNELKTLHTISSEYKEFALDEEVRGIYLGLTTIEKTEEGETSYIEAVKWLGSDKRLYLNAGKQLVETLKGLPTSIPISIRHTGKKSRMKIYEVQILG